MQPQEPANRPNTPLGYGQPQQGAPASQYAPYPGQPYPGMAPYPPPQKKGMPWWAWLLIIGGGLFALFIVVGILALAAVPLITSNTREARRAEGESLLQSARNFARVAWVKTSYVDQLTGEPAEWSPAGSGMQPKDLEGMYFEVNNVVEGEPGSSTNRAVTCSPGGQRGVASDGTGRLQFDMMGQPGPVTWH